MTAARGRGQDGMGESGEPEAAQSVTATGHKMAEERPVKKRGNARQGSRGNHRRRGLRGEGEEGKFQCC